MTNNPEIQFLKVNKVNRKKIILLGIILCLLIFFLGKKFLTEEPAPIIPKKDLSSEIHYIGYIQTSKGFLALIQLIESQKIIDARIGTHLLNSVIQKISPQQIELLSENGEKDFIKFIGEK